MRTKRCKCGGWRASEAERCAGCAEALKATTPEATVSADVEAALADECPNKAKHVEAVLGRIAARKERANANH